MIDPPAPTVSVVIPTYNRVQSLARTMAGLAGQVPVDGGFEVIVVSDGSTDGTDAYLASAAVPLPVTALSQENGGPAAARNHGVESASGTLVLFIDDDVVPTPDLITNHVDAHDHPDDDLVVIGPMNTPDDVTLSPWVQWEQDMLYKQYEAMQRKEFEPTARQFYTGNASVARRHLVAAGGFDESFRRAEDVELAYRLADSGLRFAFDPDAVVLHYAERSYDAWLYAAHAYGRNDVIFARDRGQGWLLESISTEFRARHALVQAVVRLCLPRPRLQRAASSLLSGAARLSSPLRLDGLTRAALSAVYNLSYYRGVADELGDPRQLLARFRDAA